MKRYQDMTEAERDAAFDYSEYIGRAKADGGYLGIGRGGATLWWRNGHLSGPMEAEIKRQSIAAGLLVIDSRMVPIADVYDVAVRGPLVAIGEKPDQEPYHALSRAPLAYVVARYRTIGAEIHNP